MKLQEFQQKLKAPKGQFNAFGKYKYRSCEDIVEAVKPIIHSEGYHLILSDEVLEVGGRVYVKATATLTNGEQIYQSSAYAREELEKKGMDASQITGAASSYARKYALNGLFAIDDTKDSDATNTHGKEAENAPEPKEELPWMNDKVFHTVIQRIQTGDFRELGTVEKFMENVFNTYRMKTEYRKAIDEELSSTFNKKINE